MGNIDSKKANFINGTSERNACDDIPIWSSEMWTPNLTVLMSSDSKHVVVRYRTSGTEVIEIRARGTNHKIAKELIDFGRSLHTLSARKNCELRRNFPTLTLFLNDPDGSNCYGGFVEVCVEHETDGDGDLCPSESKTKSYSFQTENAVVTEKTALKIEPPVAEVDTSKKLLRQHSIRTRTERVGRRSRQGRNTSTFSSNKSSVTLTNAQSIPSKRPLRRRITVSGIRKYQRKKVTKRNSIARSSTKDKAKSLQQVETHTKTVNILESKFEDSYVIPLSKINALDVLEENTSSTSASDSENTPPTEIEFSDSDVTLQQCAIKLSGNTKPYNLKNTTTTATKPNRLETDPPPSARVSTEKVGKELTDGTISKLDTKDQRQQAWLAFVRTLKHHDPENCNDTSWSNFSDCARERLLLDS